MFNKNYLYVDKVHNDTSKKISTHVQNEANSLESTISDIEIQSPSSIGVFVDGKLKLTCEATQFSIYKQSAETIILDDSPHIALVIGQTPAPGKLLFE